jgi:hypothetical protein
MPTAPTCRIGVPPMPPPFKIARQATFLGAAYG